LIALNIGLYFAGSRKINAFIIPQNIIQLKNLFFLVGARHVLIVTCAVLTRALITSVFSDMGNTTCDVRSKAVKILVVEFAVRFSENPIASRSRINPIAFGISTV